MVASRRHKCVACLCDATCTCVGVERYSGACAVAKPIAEAAARYRYSVNAAHVSRTASVPRRWVPLRLDRSGLSSARPVSESGCLSRLLRVCVRAITTPFVEVVRALTRYSMNAAVTEVCLQRLLPRFFTLLSVSQMPSGFPLLLPGLPFQLPSVSRVSCARGE